ncbi:CBN-SRJ-18 protein [Caenorhabditis brenneri]|uniref:CBN-SRJ-18 protein n=1 Tax=Caenorhabditis brenneri TaxID=135651 RepID=G0MT59_CAEBE|nr:CBN-SRJ-18 protein [Caenorhabditis brenneri]
MRFKPGRENSRKVWQKIRPTTIRVFVYLIGTERKFQFGDYKYLLYFFATFNMIASIADLLVPVCVHSYRYATVFFTVGGPFLERSDLAETLIAFRCAFISGTYGILNSHFIFRFMILRNNHFVARYFFPYGLLSAIFLVIFHIAAWGVVADYTMHPSEESRKYAKKSFEQAFGGNIEDVNMKITIFSESSADDVFRSWLGAIIVTILASYSVTLYFTLGYKIMNGLNKTSTSLSPKTTQMQKRLFMALFVQTAIPICVSFLPCILVLFGSAFRIDFAGWVNWISSVAVSTFPVLDPMAIIFCLPALRQRLFRRFGLEVPLNSNNQVQSISRI